VERAAERGEGEKLLRSVDSLFAQYQRVDIYGRKEQLCRNGNPFRLGGEDGIFRFYGEEGSFLMLGRRKDGEVRTIKSFF
jgi:hypothetical protein